MKKYLAIIFILTMAISAFAVTIYDVQYTDDAGDGTYPSPYADQEVTVEGIITGTNWSGWNQSFYIQMEDQTEWGGLLVYGSGDSTLVIGDKVSVTGTVTEYYGFTELGDVTNVELLASNQEAPAAVQLSCNEVASNEAYECVLVNVQDVYVFSGIDDYGQWVVIDMDGDTCQIDDGFYIAPPYEIVEGNEIESITGIVDYSYDEYGLHPRMEEDFYPATDANDNVNHFSFTTKSYPNPYSLSNNRNEGISIEFNIPEPGQVKVEVFNILGQKIKTVVNDYYASSDVVTWNGKNSEGENVTSGVYFYKVSKGRYTSTKKMILIK